MSTPVGANNPYIQEHAALLQKFTADKKFTPDEVKEAKNVLEKFWKDGKLSTQEYACQRRVIDVLQMAYPAQGSATPAIAIEQ